LFQVNTAAAITSNNDKAVLLIVPFTVITSEEAVVYSLRKTFSLNAGFELFVKFIMAVKINF
jgi:hypothetical protein